LEYSREPEIVEDKNGQATDSKTYLAVPESALHMIHGFIVSRPKAIKG